MLKKTILFAVILLFSGFSPSEAARRIDMGEAFPEIALPQPLTAEGQSYLGLSSAEPFTLSQVKGEVVLVEVLNVLCPHCQKQTLPYGKLFEMIEADPVTRGRIKMLGVAVGNSPVQIEDFVDVYDVDFPIVSDRAFKFHSAVGGGPTPFSIYLRKDAGKVGFVAGTHLGEDKQMDDLFAYLKEALLLPVSEFSSIPQNEVGETPAIAAFLPPKAMSQRVRQAFAQLGKLSDFQELKLPSQRRVYMAEVGGQRLFAEVLARSAICDICHNVHFFYLFDSKGKILGFEPLHLTRYGNVNWNPQEIEKMRKRLVGGFLTRPWNFNPEVDAVSRATMTSAIIFNSLDQGKALMEELERGKYLNGAAK